MRRARERAYCSRPTRTLTGLCQPWRATSPSSPSAAAFTCCVEHRSTDCFHPRLGVGVMVGEKERPTRNQGLRKLRTSWSFLPFSNCLGACPSASLAVPGGGVHPLGPQGVPQGGVRHRGGQGAQRPPAAGVQAGFILAYGLRGGEGEPEVPAVSEGSAVRAGLSKYLCPPELPCPAAGSGRTKI